MRETERIEPVQAVREDVQAREDPFSRLRERLDRLEPDHSEGPVEGARETDEVFEPADREAIRDYTDEGYRRLNRPLREGDGAEVDPEIQAQADRLSAALRKCPTYQGDVFRGTNLTDAEVEKYVPGSVVEERAFTSTSKDAGFAGDTAFFIESRTGRDIESLSTYPAEHEVLFDRSTRFEVLGRDRLDGMNYIYLKEA